MSKKTNQLDAATDAECKNDSYLDPLADPVNGLSKKRTVAQAKEVYQTKKFKYTATGTEGTSITIPQLEGYDILLIMRESGPLFETGVSPDSSEFTWNDITIGLGNPANPGERFLIMYKNY